MKNWTVKEAVAVINAGTDKEAIKEIVKHFPLFAVIAAGKDFDGLAQAMPESLTVRKVETVLNAGATATDVDTDEEVDTDGEVAEEETGDEDLSSMSTKQLIALCGKRGIKVPKYGKNKQFYLDALNGGAEEPEEEAEEAEEEEEEDDGAKAVELFKKCKKAGIKVPKGKDAKFYQAKLDELESEDDEDEDDDWDEDEEVEEKPKKADKKKAGKKEEKKADKKTAKKSKKAEPEEDADDDEDDDDDWDI